MKNPYWKTLRPVWENPRRVYANGKRIENVARKLAAEKVETPSWNEPIFPEKPLDFMKFILVANAINFCFTEPKTKEKFAVNHKGVLWRGAMAMAACLKRALDEGRPLFNADYLSNLTMEEMENIFRTDPNAREPPMPFLREKRDILAHIGYDLKSYFSGSFLAIYEISDFRAFNDGKGLAEILPRYFPSFKDARKITIGNEEHILKFQKRAQLLAMVYQGRAKSTPGWPFPLLKDADALGPLADCAVPAALEDAGILVYSQSLKNKIKDGEIIPENSREEIEIRAQTVFAMLKLLEQTNKFRSAAGKGTISMVELDYLVWKLGRGIKTRHLTPTTAY